MKNCPKSESGEHAYQPHTHGRDDQGFYLNCVYCGKASFFPADTEDELYSMFGIDDDDERDYSHDDL